MRGRNGAKQKSTSPGAKTEEQAKLLLHKEDKYKSDANNTVMLVQPTISLAKLIKNQLNCPSTVTFFDLDDLKIQYFESSYKYHYENYSFDRVVNSTLIE